MGLGGGAGMPVYLLQAATRPAAHYYDNPADVDGSHFGPPLKRRKIDHESSPGSNRSRSRSRERNISRSPAKSALETLANVSLGVLA